MSDLLDVVHMNNDVARNNADALRRLASSFYSTGNEIVGRKLDLIADGILGIAKEVDRAFSDDLTEKVNAARNNSVNLLVGVLSGIGIGQRAAEAAEMREEMQRIV